MNVYGELDGLRRTTLQSLETLYDMNIPAGDIITDELAIILLNITNQLNREIGVYINRRGKVLRVFIGNIQTVNLPELNEKNSMQRLSGVRCIHTHPQGCSKLSNADLSALQRMRFDVMVAIAIEKEVINASLAFLTGDCNNTGNLEIENFGPTTISELNKINLHYLTTLVDKKLTKSQMIDTIDDDENALLLGLDLPNKKSNWNIADSLNELKQLAETAGAIVIDKMIQKRDSPDSGLFFGKGKLKEVASLIQENNINLIICDDELSPSQQRNIEQFLGVKVIDRTLLILDIFARRARSYEGKLQVELAQLHYNLPRIGGQGLILSRLGGGIGTRGPGETKLEVDKRRIRARISDIERQIENVKKQRILHRSNRQASNIPMIALVGYTNAGKSTLLNTLTAAGVLAEDKLFATLDPTTRKVILANNQEVLLTDTVGFIQKLPHQLISAFRATLEEVQSADLLLHVVDCSHENYMQQIKSVLSVLKELEVIDKSTITVFNKIDKIDSEDERNNLLRTANVIGISAKKNIGIIELLKHIEKFVLENHMNIEILIPYESSSIVANLHDDAVIKETVYRKDGTYMKVSIPTEKYKKYSEYIIGE